MNKIIFPFLVLFPWLLLLTFTSCAQKKKNQDKVTEVDKAALEQFDKATVAGGCFWCVEAVFERVKGVKEAVSGYSGGSEENPTYEAVASGKTSHAEAVEIYYDPEVISYKEILEIFFATHDPTTLNRQGPDVGSQYRSAIFYHNDDQRIVAQQTIDRLENEKKFKNPIVTELVPYVHFYQAEDYHQNYYEHNPRNPYIINVTRPKILKFEKDYKDYLKDNYRRSN